MKKWIFIVTCLVLCCYLNIKVVKAETMNLGEDGIYEFLYTIITGEEDITYQFQFIASGYPINEDETAVFYLDSSEESHFVMKLTTEQYDTDEEGVWLQSTQKGSITLPKDADVQSFIVQYYAQYPTTDWVRYEVLGTLQESIIPTITPTITPVPTPIVELKVSIEEGKAVANYNTSGSTIISSSIELYEVSTLTNVDILIDEETFFSGSGTMKHLMEPGKVYKYKLCCVYEQEDGIQYEESIWSDDITIKDKEIEDYRESGKITNFRTLMLYIWENVMTLEISIEGYSVSFQQLFTYSMVAMILVGFFRMYNGR